jgi:hypothetical protein
MTLRTILVYAPEEKMPGGRVIVGDAEGDVLPIFLFFVDDAFDVAEVADVTDEETLSLFLGDLKEVGWWDDATDVDRRLLEGLAANSIPAEVFDEYIELNGAWLEETGVLGRLMEIEDAADDCALGGAA